MPDLILATDNPGKVCEFQELARTAGFTLRTMREAGFTGSIQETGSTYEENARIKARTVHQQLGGYVLADDSGLSVDVLDGAPGIHSARFAGAEATWPDKIAALYAWLKPLPPETWHASFICVLVLIGPDGQEWTTRGECRGMIAPAAAGSHGFGYDPIFFLPEYGKTMAELAPALKNQISHRARAVSAMIRLLAPDGGLSAADGQT